MGGGNCSRTGRASRRGFTSIEVAIASAGAAALLALVFSMISVGQGTVETGITRTRLDGHTRQALDRMADDLRSAQLQAFAGGVDACDSVTFKRRYGKYENGLRDFDLQAGTVLWNQLPSDSFQLQLAPGEVQNGIDDNANGVADECDLVHVSNGTRTVLCRDVAPGGLTFRLVSPRKLEIGLRLEALDGRKNRITVQSSTLVFLRN